MLKSRVKCIMLASYNKALNRMHYIAMYVLIHSLEIVTAA